MTIPRVLNVGQCGFDSGKISRFLRDSFQVQTVSVDTIDDALSTLRSGSFQLVLVNRILDLNGSPGLDLIRAIKADPSLATVPAMLVSNYPQAQADAISLGAFPGFGKADIGRPRAEEALRPVFAPTTTQP